MSIIQKEKEELLDGLSPKKRALLALRLKELKTSRLVKADGDLIQKEDRSDINKLYPLSYSQERLWFMEQFSRDKHLNNLINLSVFQGKLDISNLEKSLEIIVNRHETLHTTFHYVDDEVKQKINKTFPVQMMVTDLSLYKSEDEKEAIFNSLVLDRSSEPFNLESGPMIYFELFKYSDEKHILLILVHHIIFDGFSFQVLLHELRQVYESLCFDIDICLPEISTQYVDYAVWNRDIGSHDKLKEQLTFWKEQLKNGIPRIQLPNKKTRTNDDSHEGDTVSLEISSELMHKLNQVAVNLQCTPFVLYMTVFKILLYKFTGQENLVVGTPVANRNRAEILNLIGCFINTILIKTNCNPNYSFAELIKEVKDYSYQALKHTDIPFEKILSELNLENEHENGQLFQVLFNYQKINTIREMDSALQIYGKDFNRALTFFDLNLSIIEGKYSIELKCMFNKSKFERNIIEQLMDGYLKVLESIVANPDKKIHDIQILSKHEINLQINKWNNNYVNYGNELKIHDIFTQKAIQYPNSIALRDSKKSYTYSELNSKANKLANFLLSKNVKKEQCIGILMNRSVDLVLSILGILKAGCAYVPIDPVYPANRISHMLEEASIDYLIGESDLFKNCEISKNINCIDLGVLDGPNSNLSDNNPDIEIKLDNLCYVIFTSGSTGKPKGVAVEHKNILNYTLGIIPRMKLKGQMNFAQVTTFSADLGMAMLWGALCSGGTLHVLSYETAADPKAYRDYFIKNQIDIVKLVPSHFETLQEEQYKKELLPNHCLILAGEIFRSDIVEKIKSLNPECLVQNHYGPTESTVSILTYEVNTKESYDNVPLGRPINNVSVYVFDKWLNPLPVGVPGELYIGGESVSRGYLGQDNSKNSNFIADPYKSDSKLYKTGDLVCYRGDGNIEYLGRIDKQIKLRGYRIEPGEIENLINDFTGVKSSLVLLDDKNLNNKRLISYITLTDPNLCIQDLKAYLRPLIPEYMIPSSYNIIDSIPLNANGKIDFNSLPEPDFNINIKQVEIELPSNKTEEIIAEIWQNILGIDQIGVRSDFFDLGGDSFKAVRAVRQIDSALSVLDLLRNPTIKQLAKFLDNDDIENRELITEIRKARNDTDLLNIICIPHGGGSGIIYHSMTKSLPENFSLHVVNLPGHEISNPDDNLLPLNIVAKKCIDEITEKITGPIAIYAQCLGGALAIAIADLLRKSDIQLEVLFLGANFPSPRLPGKFFNVWSKILPNDRIMSNSAYRDMLLSFGAIEDDMDEKEIEFMIKALRHDVREAEEYYTKCYSDESYEKFNIPITCIFGEMDRTTEFFRERVLEWEYFSESVDMSVIPGAGHFFQKHQADTVIEIIKEKIELKKSTIKEDEQNRKIQKTDFSYDIKPDLRTFFIVAIGQLISTIGSRLTGFALNIWVFQQTSRVTDFVIVNVFGILPGILLLPIAGAVADKWDRRKIMIITDIAATLCTIAIAIIFWLNALSIWHLCVSGAIVSMALAFQRPAHWASVTQLVPKRYLSRANGVIQLISSISDTLAPLLGALLLVSVGLRVIFIIDFATFLFAITTLLCVRFPNALFKKLEEPVLKEMASGWKYIIKRHCLVVMIIYFSIFNLFNNIAMGIFTPMILSFSEPETLGIITMMFSIGGLVASLILSILGGLKRKAIGMIAGVVGTGFFLMIVGFRPQVNLVAIGAFGTLFSIVVINTHWLTMMQTKVNVELQGRVISMNQMMAWMSIPIGLLLAGPLSDFLFEPIIRGEVSGLNFISNIFGDGPGRGMGVLISIAGLIIFILGLIGFRLKRLRYIEDELPDAIPDAIILKDKDLLQAKSDRNYEKHNMEKKENQNAN